MAPIALTVYEIHMRFKSKVIVDSCLNSFESADDSQKKQDAS